MGRRWKIGSESPVHADTRQYWSTPQVRLVACTCTISVCFAIWKNMFVLTLHCQENVFGRISCTAKTCFQPAQWLHKPRAKSTQSILLILTFAEAAFEQTSQCQRLAREIMFRICCCLCFAFVNDAVIHSGQQSQHQTACRGAQAACAGWHLAALPCPQQSVVSSITYLHLQQLMMWLKLATNQPASPLPPLQTIASRQQHLMQHLVISVLLRQMLLAMLRPAMQVAGHSQACCCLLCFTGPPVQG